MESWQSTVTHSAWWPGQEVADGGCVSYVCLPVTLGLPLITAGDFISNGPISNSWVLVCVCV